MTDFTSKAGYSVPVEIQELPYFVSSNLFVLQSCTLHSLYRTVRDMLSFLFYVQCSQKPSVPKTWRYARPCTLGRAMHSPEKLAFFSPILQIK
jgi:hypothetical protein